MYRCVIIDDEPLAAQALSEYLEFFPDFSVQKVYNDPLIALQEIVADQGIDCIFMDVQMPQMSGIELANALRHKTQKLVFCTAYAEFGFEAFDLGVDAYLLKPYTLAKFAKTIYKLFPQGSTQINVEDFCLVKSVDDHLIKKVNYIDIVFLESIGNYLRIHLQKDVFTVYMGLKEFYRTLADDQNFIQISRSFIISQTYIENINGQTIEMSNGSKLTIGKNYRGVVSQLIRSKLL